MPGGNAINFVKQWAQAGLSSIPLYSVYTVDHASLKPIGNAALGTLGVAQYVEDLPNAANKKFVADFTKRNGYPPSEYAAQAFDTAMLINSAVVATKGEVSDTKAFGEALMQAKFESVRGNFKFNRNHMPIQNYYLRETVKLPDGSLGFVTKETVTTAYQDFYVGRCTAIK
jgi:branched-chain amino acid transport system substrate-binding protein